MFYKLGACAHRHVLHIDESYVVIDKPHGVRLDGDHPVTIEKLLSVWLPYLFPVGNTIRFVHQLDYATSGCLCIALNRAAASAACKLFEERKVLKTYEALVYGHIDIDAFPKVPKDYRPTFRGQGS